MSETPQDNNSAKKRGKSRISLVFLLVALLVSGGVYLLSKTDYFSSNTPEEILVNVSDENDFDKIENGIHVRTGFVDAPGLMETVQNCTTCHSSQLVLQNRMNKERWTATIKWMQETQNLWDLGENQAVIVNYLATNYPPIEKGRRENLSDIEWYVLEE